MLHRNVAAAQGLAGLLRCVPQLLRFFQVVALAYEGVLVGRSGEHLAFGGADGVDDGARGDAGELVALRHQHVVVTTVLLLV